MRHTLRKKSAESEKRQILSVEAQISELKEFAAKEKLELSLRFANPKLPKNMKNIGSNFI